MSIIQMLIISIIAGLLSGMNMWVVDPDDMQLHINDFYMAILMTGWMLFMETILDYNHYKDIKLRLIIAILIISFTIFAIRKQFFVTDKQFLKGMIPQHSMAILMSEKILKKTKNPKIKKLAYEIIKSQEKEINEMNQIIKQS